MRKSILILFLLLFPLTFSVAESSTVYTGFVTGPEDTGFVFHTGDRILRLPLGPDTVLDTERELQDGDYVTVTVTGTDHGGIPHTERILQAVLTGTVSGPADSGFLLQPDSGEDPVLVLTDSEWPSGFPVTVFWNGMMTRSIPPRINALHIRGRVLEGTVSEVGEDGSFLLTTDSGDCVIAVTPETVCLTGVLRDAFLTVEIGPLMTLSEPPRVNALVIR